jgi:hypothetical protein
MVEALAERLKSRHGISASITLKKFPKSGSKNLEEKIRTSIEEILMLVEY